MLKTSLINLLLIAGCALIIMVILCIICFIICIISGSVGILKDNAKEKKRIKEEIKIEAQYDFLNKIIDKYPNICGNETDTYFELSDLIEQ